MAVILGCNKDAAKPKPTGSIKAVVSPEGAVTKMVLSKSAASIEILPVNDDTFWAKNLEDGPYLIAFWPAKDFNVPKYMQTITITNGEAIDLDTLFFEKRDTRKPGEMSATINNIEWIFYTNEAKWSDSTLLISGTGYTKNQYSNPQDILIGLKHVKGPGIYSSPSFAGVGISMYRPDDFLYSTEVQGGNINVNLTKFDTVNNRFSGDFNFLALPIPGSTMLNTKNVTNGIFTDVLIR